MNDKDHKDSKLEAERTDSIGAQGAYSSDAVTEEFPVIDEETAKAVIFDSDNTVDKPTKLFDRFKRKPIKKSEKKEPSSEDEALIDSVNDEGAVSEGGAEPSIPEETIPEQKNTPGEKKPVKKKTHDNRLYAILGGVTAACLALALCACGVCLYVVTQQQAQQSSASPAASFQAQDSNSSSSEANSNSAANSSKQDAAEQTTSTDNQQAVCEHEFERVWKEEKVADSVETKEVPAQMGTRTVNHTLCNVCLEQVDGNIEKHKQETGHDAGYTPNVPCEETYEISPESTETVVKKGYTVYVSDSEECIHCHMLRSADRIVKDEEQG